MSLLNGVALVTGAASGIGRELALAYTRAGCSAITLADLNMEGLQTTTKLIEEENPLVKTLSVKVDTTNEASVAMMVADTIKEFGHLDYAANVAGVSVQHRLPTSEYPQEDYERVLNINVTGVLLCIREEVKAMKSQEPKNTPGVQDPSRAQRGSIVNIASVTGLAAIQNIMPYNVSKHAVIGLTKSAAIDHGWQQIRINAVCPGMADTPLVKSRKQLEDSDKSSTWSTDGNVLSRLALPAEIADVCVFLSSTRASYMAGTSVTIDGGHTAALRYEHKIADALKSQQS